MLSRILFVLAAFLALGSAASAHDFKAGDIEIGHPWSRATPAAAPVAGGYVRLTNTGTESDRLIEVTSPIAKSAEIHQSTVVDGVARMRPLADGLVIPPGKTVDFETERLHFMFIEPARPLKDKDRFAATLVFEKAGPVEVEFVVQRGSARPDEPDAHAGHGAAGQ